MSDENNAPNAAPETSAPPSDPSSSPPGDETPKVDWKFKRNLGINEEMKKVIGLTIDAANSEITALRRKLEKLQYGA
jgi:hypothetical protein